MTPAAGAEQGASAVQTGVTGPRITCPKSPLDPGDAVALLASRHPAATRTTAILIDLDLPTARAGLTAGPRVLRAPYGRYGVSLLIRVDQLPNAALVPGAPADGAHVPRRLSPVPPVKNGPPQVV